MRCDPGRPGKTAGGQAVNREEMIVACCTDLAGKVRGKAFPASQFDKRLRRGIGWTPTNVQITCFDVIAESPFGSLGDLVLLPDEAARVRVDFGDGEPVEHFALGDISHTDGRPWEFCTRSILKAALDRLERRDRADAVRRLRARVPVPRPAGSDSATPTRSAGFRAERRLAETLMAAMRAAGLEPDTFMKEYGRRPVRGDDGTGSAAWRSPTIRRSCASWCRQSREPPRPAR